jgi:hypothetical protein
MVRAPRIGLRTGVARDVPKAYSPSP